jgi:hypothetical protein
MQGGGREGDAVGGEMNDRSDDRSTQYVRRAEDCVHRADELSDPQNQLLMLRLAEGWLSLADLTRKSFLPTDDPGAPETGQQRGPPLHAATERENLAVRPRVVIMRDRREPQTAPELPYRQNGT